MFFCKVKMKENLMRKSCLSNSLWPRIRP